MKKVLTICAVVVMVMAVTGVAQAVLIDGTITAGEWDGAATGTIGNGGGTVYLKADTDYIYGAFDITGWDPTAENNLHGNKFGFGVWNADNSYPTDGVEFWQSSIGAGTLPSGYSEVINGLDSAFGLDGVVQGFIPGDLQAMHSTATGHYVWEVMMPISTMTVVDNTVWVVGGIDYSSAQHWYPDTFLPNYDGYIPVTVVPEPATMALLALGGLLLRRKK